MKFSLFLKKIWLACKRFYLWIFYRECLRFIRFILWKMIPKIYFWIKNKEYVESKNKILYYYTYFKFWVSDRFDDFDAYLIKRFELLESYLIKCFNLTYSFIFKYISILDDIYTDIGNNYTIVLLIHIYTVTIFYYIFNYIFNLKFVYLKKFGKTIWFDLRKNKENFLSLFDAEAWVVKIYWYIGRILLLTYFFYLLPHGIVAWVGLRLYYYGFRYIFCFIEFLFFDFIIADDSFIGKGYFLLKKVIFFVFFDSIFVYSFVLLGYVRQLFTFYFWGKLFLEITGFFVYCFLMFFVGLGTFIYKWGTRFYDFYTDGGSVWRFRWSERIRRWRERLAKLWDKFLNFYFWETFEQYWYDSIIPKFTWLRIFFKFTYLRLFLKNCFKHIPFKVIYLNYYLRFKFRFITIYWKTRSNFFWFYYSFINVFRYFKLNVILYRIDCKNFILFLKTLYILRYALIYMFINFIYDIFLFLKKIVYKWLGLGMK